MAKKQSEEITADNVDEILAAASAQVPEEQNPLQSLAHSFAKMTEIMALLVAKQEAGDGQASALARILAPALERMAESNLAGAKLITDEQRRAHRPSNEFPHLRSVFNRRGVLLDEQFPEGHAGVEGADPVKRPLKCTMMLPWLAEWESLTREEVELLNLLQPGGYVIRRIDNSRIKIDVACEYKVDGVTPTRLVVNHETAYNNDNHKLWPSIVEWTRQALKQHDREIQVRAAAIMSDEEEEALIEAGQLVVSR
jgi:hypothetical protein